MQVSLFQLRRFAPDLPDAPEVARLLTLGGLEVSALRPAAPVCSGIVVGRVTSFAPVPGSKNLSLCQVDAGGRSPFSVVCGAPNIEMGQCYPFARPGAVLPGGMKIGERKMRGVLSQGMLCSADELQLGDDVDGILPLQPELEPGRDVRRLFGDDDWIFDLELTPDRADCFGALGIARDAAALAGVDFAPPTAAAVEQEAAPVEENAPDQVQLRIEAPADCPRYCGRVVSGLRADAPSPLWLREQLRRHGVRSISAVVDITNYVQMELGQPLHAFDFAVTGDLICVRRAAQGEKLQLLDESALELSVGDLLIADGDRPLALAGVMGGQRSGTGEATTSVLLESAFFNPATVRAGRTRHAVNTEASRRFERGVCPQLQRRALDRATQLVLRICGGAAGPVSEKTSEADLPPRPLLELSGERLNALLGAQIEPETATDVLHRLGLAPQFADGLWRVQVPSHRFDLECAEDLVEEVARTVGYDQLPEAAPAVGGGDAGSARSLAVRREQMRDFLAARGWNECITYSFLSPEVCRRLCPAAAADERMQLTNPLTDSRSVMRSTLLPGLLETMRHNLHHRQQRLRLFEMGVCFLPPAADRADAKAAAPHEQMRLAMLATGPRHSLSWAEDRQQQTDFYDLKGLLETLLASQHCAVRWREPDGRPLPGGLAAFDPQPAAAPLLHPGQQALLEIAGEGQFRPVALVAGLHPEVAADFDVSGDVLYAELLPDELPHPSELRPMFRPFPRLPRIERDLSLLVPGDCSAAKLLQVVYRAGGAELISCRIFDLYQLDHRQSVAIALEWQPVEESWASAQVEERTAAIVRQLNKEGVQLRS